MKKFLLLFVFLPILVSAQNLLIDNFPVKDGKIVYSEVVSVDSTLTINDLYLNAKNWLSVSFNSSKEGIQTDDKANALIIAKGFMEISEIESSTTKPKEWFLLKLELKQGRYRYTLSEIKYQESFKYDNTQMEMPFELYFATKIDRINKIAANPDKRNVKLAKEYMDSFMKFNGDLNNGFHSLISSLKTAMAKKVDNNW